MCNNVMQGMLACPWDADRVSASVPFPSVISFCCQLWLYTPIVNTKVEVVQVGRQVFQSSSVYLWGL